MERKREGPLSAMKKGEMKKCVLKGKEDLEGRESWRAVESNEDTGEKNTSGRDFTVCMWMVSDRAVPS